MAALLRPKGIDPLQDHEWFKLTRQRLGLTGDQLGTILGVDGRRIRAWEQDPETTSSARSANPIAVQVLKWMLKGFDPARITQRRTGPAMSKLAARVLNGYTPTDDETRSMAASLLSQDEDGLQ